MCAKIKNRLLKSVSAAFLVGTMIFLSSCIKEDYSNCYSSVLNFVYKADGEDNVITKYIDNATLYLYDEEGKLVHTKEVDKLSQQYKLQFYKPGNYTLVALGNVKSYSKINKEEKLNSANVQSQTSTKAEKYVQNDPLYSVKMPLSIDGKHNKKEIVEFNAAHIGINVRCINFKAVYGADFVPEIAWRGAGNRYDFKDFSSIPQPKGSVDFMLSTEYNKENKTFSSYFNSYRFLENTEITLDVLDKGVVVESVSLKEVIRNASLGFSLNEHNEVELNINLKYDDVGVLIVTIGWEHDDLTPIL